MASVNWNELNRQKVREIVLSGDTGFNQQLEDEKGLNELIYKIGSLNFLEITNTSGLTNVSSNIVKLANLTNLVLQGNKLESVPAEIGSLTKLKCLDLSRNQIDELPENIFENLSNLQMLNLEQNQLTKLPDMSGLTGLLILKCGSNQIQEFPASLCDKIYKKLEESSHSPIPIYGGGSVHLGELFASHNQIDSIPYTISKLTVLKSIDLSFNKIVLIPKELADCGKLKELNLKENPVKDRRLYKLIDQCPPKKILDYVRANVPPSVRPANDKSSSAGGTNDSGSKRTESESSSEDGIVIAPSKFITIEQSSDDVFKIIATKSILQMRKIVCCILHNVDLSNPKVFKKFLAIQTKLHQGICDSRQKATIATHDYAKIVPVQTYAKSLAATLAAGKKGKGPNAAPVEAPTEPPPPPPKVAFFDGRVPTKIRFVPLGRSNRMTAMELYRSLNEEADQYRKEKKRNTISGIHKYIHLLKGKSFFPVLLDNSNNVLSLPPLVNSEFSKISPTTTDILVEVTGLSVPICRAVMNELIDGFVNLEVQSEEEPGKVLTLFDPVANQFSLGNTGGDSSGKSSNTTGLIIEPVMVETTEGELIVKFPAKIDLQLDNVQVNSR